MYAPIKVPMDPHRKHVNGWCVQLSFPLLVYPHSTWFWAFTITISKRNKHLSVVVAIRMKDTLICFVTWIWPKVICIGEEARHLQRQPNCTYYRITLNKPSLVFTVFNAGVYQFNHKWTNFSNNKSHLDQGIIRWFPWTHYVVPPSKWMSCYENANCSHSDVDKKTKKRVDCWAPTTGVNVHFNCILVIHDHYKEMGSHSRRCKKIDIFFSFSFHSNGMFTPHYLWYLLSYTLFVHGID